MRDYLGILSFLRRLVLIFECPSGISEVLCITVLCLQESVLNEKLRFLTSNLNSHSMTAAIQSLGFLPMKCRNTITSLV